MRGSYKTALRAKGIRPVPPHSKLRSYRIGDQAITASEPVEFDGFKIKPTPLVEMLRRVK